MNSPRKTDDRNEAAHNAAHSNKLPEKQAHVNSRLQAIIEAWPSLSKADQDRIYSIAQPEAASRDRNAPGKRGGK
jgi:hypothetical protein